LRKTVILSVVIVFVLLITTSCKGQNATAPIISVNPDSDYKQTFEDLSLGAINDFQFKLPEADKRWVKVWVESYVDGVKSIEPLTQLSYGISPNKIDEGHLGMGIINHQTENPLLFLYAPGVSQTPQSFEKAIVNFGFNTWDYAIGEEEMELELGKTYLLAVHRQTDNNSIRTYDYQDESELNKMIKEDRMVLLLKIKVEEDNEDSFEKNAPNEK
jgi:hypothetical protein